MSLNPVVKTGMALKGEAKKLYQRIYMKSYMREYRKLHPPVLIRAVFEYNQSSDNTVAALWASNRESGTLRYPETDWDDDMLAMLHE